MQHLEDIMSKEMSRKEFLATIGFGMASVFGLSTILQFFFGKGSHQQSSASAGYGSNLYGGK